ncbi:STAS domain-containing protein [Modestobacter versicolor]|uniref:STAS domain-containing protein n=1 Tax=Modestobacter versicolor TaxID=429133 RepID=UPI0034DEA8B9
MVLPSSPTGPQQVAPLSVSVDLARASVRVAGELDRDSAHHLLDAVSVLTTGPAPRWQVDTSGVTFCDVGGVRALSSAHALAVASGRSLRLVRTSRPVDRLVQLLGHDRVFPARGSADGPRCDVVRAPASRRQAAPSAWARHVRCGTTRSV